MKTKVFLALLSILLGFITSALVPASLGTVAQFSTFWLICLVLFNYSWEHPDEEQEEYTEETESL